MTQIVDKRLVKMCNKCQSMFDKPCAWLSLGNEYCTEIMETQEVINQLTNNWNELEDILKIKKARMLNEPDYSKYYLEGYETAIQTTHSSHSGIMLETAKNSIVVLCDELLDKMKEIRDSNNEPK